ncbi:MAG: prepilin-type N-terminal cleavage/methylation domain-containing protein [Candidatus Caldarchaeum sp.]
MKRGFTWMEFLVALTVLAVVAALVYPLARGVRMQVLKETCVNNLGRIGGAVVAYREEWDGIGKYGLPWAMGLPLPLRAAIPKEEINQYPECPLEYPYLSMYPSNDVEPWWRVRIPGWLRHVEKRKERAVILVCIVHRPGKGYDPKFGLGLLVEGSVEARWGWTEPDRFSFWED